jgi:hypothetical protein
MRAGAPAAARAVMEGVRPPSGVERPWSRKDSFERGTGMPSRAKPTPDEQAGPGAREPRIEHKHAFLIAGLRYEGRNEPANSLRTLRASWPTG